MILHFMSLVMVYDRNFEIVLNHRKNQNPKKLHTLSEYNAPQMSANWAEKLFEI